MKKSFKDGNNMVKAHVEEVVEKLEYMARKHDNLILIAATVDSENGESGKLYRVRTNVSVSDITQTFVNLAQRDEAYRTAMRLAVEYLDQNKDDEEIPELIKKLMEQSGGVVAAGTIDKKTGKVEITHGADNLQELFEMIGKESGKAPRKKKVLGMEVAEEKPKEKKKLKIKDLLKGDEEK